MTTTLSSANAERLKQAFQQCRDMEGTLSEQLEAYAAAGREITVYVAPKVMTVDPVPTSAENIRQLRDVRASRLPPDAGSA